MELYHTIKVTDRSKCTSSCTDYAQIVIHFVLKNSVQLQTDVLLKWIGDMMRWEKEQPTPGKSPHLLPYTPRVFTGKVLGIPMQELGLSSMTNVTRSLGFAFMFRELGIDTQPMSKDAHVALLDVARNCRRKGEFYTWPSVLGWPTVPV